MISIKKIVLQIWISIYNRARCLFEHLFRVLPIRKNKIVASNIHGKNYGENPGYIFSEIINQKLNYDLVWLQKDILHPVPIGVRKVRYGSLKAMYELYTAKIIINNVKNGPVWKKRRGQYYIQTWHGAFPLKYIEKEAEDKLSPRYVELSKEDSKNTDLMISGCKMESEIMRSSFWYTGEIFECGIPRSDVLFSCGKEYISNLKDKYSIGNSVHVLLYAPTFRDDGNTSIYNLNIEEVINTLEKVYNEKWICIVRLHPNISNRDSIIKYSNSIINGSKYSDPQELILLSDILITDYSSIMMDFGIINKPVFLYTPDLDQFRNEGRGLREIFDQLPFTCCKSNQEILLAIRNFNHKKYTENLLHFIHNIYGGFDDGHACERVVKRIKDVIEA